MRHPVVAVQRPPPGIATWSANSTGSREWVESCAGQGVTVRHVVSDLQPRAVYNLRCDGQVVSALEADGGGRIEFERKLGDAKPQRFGLVVQ
jgi:hypothetical protein